MTLGERIALARKQAGLSQEQLGEQLGVSRQAVSKWESGQTNPDVAYIAELCRLFGVSSDWLLLGKEEAREQAPGRCPGCRAVVTGLDKFCPNCGRPLQSGAEGQETYSLVLVNARDDLPAARAALDRLSRKPWCPYDSPVYRLEPNQVDALLIQAPVTLMWGLSAQQAADAMACFRALDQAAVYRDSDGSSAEELIQNPKVPPQSLPSPTPGKEPMSFGATVGAVILGILAAVLILSFL